MLTISIFMACRAKQSGELIMRNALTSLIANAKSPHSLEFLLKFDDDDPRLQELTAVCDELAPKVGNLKFIITPRGAGYSDLNKAYNDLLRVASPQTELYWVISDDLEIYSKNWDSILMAHKHSDGLYMIHFMHRLWYNRISLRDDSIEGPDCYPVWSKLWIGLQGGFGHVFATDGWTSLVRHRLWTKHKIDRGFFVDIKMRRHEGADDLAGSERWNTVRKEILDLMVSDQMLQLADMTAQCFAQHIFAQSAIGKTSYAIRAFVQSNISKVSYAIRAFVHVKYAFIRSIIRRLNLEWHRFMTSESKHAFIRSIYPRILARIRRRMTSES